MYYIYMCIIYIYNMYNIYICMYMCICVCGDGSKPIVTIFGCITV